MSHNRMSMSPQRTYDDLGEIHPAVPQFDLTVMKFDFAVMKFDLAAVKFDLTARTGATVCQRTRLERVSRHCRCIGPQSL